jgi:hypothetical protein
MHPWKNAVGVSQAIVFFVGLGLLAAGILTMANR